MKGVKYTIKIKSRDETELITKNIDVFEVMEVMKKQFKDTYDLDIHITKTIIYNILNKNKADFKKKPNKLFRELVEIKKYYDTI